MKLKQKITQKATLNQTLRSWLPILQASIDDLKETLEPFVAGNPFVLVEQKPKSSQKVFFGEFYSKNLSPELERFSTYKESLYEKLYSQITAPLFPTKKSVDIANLIINYINNEGYFEWDDEILLHYDKAEVEKIRARFAYLEPCGVGAVDCKESFLFQLDDIKCEEIIYQLAKKIILNLEKIDSFIKEPHYDEAIKIIKKFKNPPAIEYLEDDILATPDIIVYINNGAIEISINDEYYPQITIDTQNLDDKHEFINAKIKEAKDLIDALEMRKSTLYKIGLMIVEYQYDYFFGGSIKPMKLKDIANDLDRNPSTISRAIQNKFLSSPRGLIAIKKFFTAAASDDVSNAAIKEFIKNTIKAENRTKPLSDEALLHITQEKFGIKLVRRTITKYRKSLNIASSGERKRIYMVNA